MKICPKCKEEKPRVEFSVCASKKDGLQSHCKVCKKHKYSEGKETLLPLKRAYYHEHKEDISEQRRLRYAATKEETRETRNAYTRARRNKDIEGHRAKNRQWYWDNVEKARESARKYSHSDKGRAHRYEYTKQYSIIKRARPLTEAAKEAKSRYQKAKRQTYRQMSEFDKFVMLEANEAVTMRTAMTGVNWHIDHIIPISKGGTSEHNNIQVVPALWNHKKYNKLLGTYFPHI